MRENGRTEKILKRQSTLIQCNNQMQATVMYQHSCISEHEMEEVMHASTVQLMLLVAFA